MSHPSRISHAVNFMLDESADAQRQAVESGRTKHLSSIAFAKGFCTVRVQGPRQCGHSTVVRCLINRFGKDKVVVYTHTLMMGKHLDATHKCSGKSIDRIRGVGGIKAVLVDVASVVSGKAMDELYSTCVPAMEGVPMYFVLLG